MRVMLRLSEVVMPKASLLDGRVYALTVWRKHRDRVRVVRRAVVHLTCPVSPPTCPFARLHAPHIFVSRNDLTSVFREETAPTCASRPTSTKSKSHQNLDGQQTKGLGTNKTTKATEDRRTQTRTN